MPDAQLRKQAMIVINNQRGDVLLEMMISSICECVWGVWKEEKNQSNQLIEGCLDKAGEKMIS